MGVTIPLVDVGHTLSFGAGTSSPAGGRKPQELDYVEAEEAFACLLLAGLTAFALRSSRTVP